jgi:hypothetical protein
MKFKVEMKVGSASMGPIIVDAETAEEAATVAMRLHLTDVPPRREPYVLIKVRPVQAWFFTIRGCGCCVRVLSD